MQTSTLNILVLAALISSNASASDDINKLMKPIHPSLDTRMSVMNDEPHPCDKPELAHYAQCDIENPANDFHWVSDDYRDNVVQVVYGYSSCGGLLVDGDLVLTARHCTPDWNEVYEWPYGDVVKIYQGIEVQNPETLVYEGQADILVHDSDQRIDDGLRFFKQNWQPIVTSIMDAWRAQGPDYNTGKDFEGTYSLWRNWYSDSFYNDVAIIKLPQKVSHHNHNAFITIDNFDPTLKATVHDYNLLVNQPAETKFNYQGWGQNAYGVTPERMKHWQLSYHKGQSTLSWSTTSDGKILSTFFDTDLNFFPTMDAESLINPGDSGTPLFTEDNYNVGIASRIWGAGDGFAADWSAHLTNLEFYKAAIDRLVAPSEFSQTVYTDSDPVQWTFDVQNLSYNGKAVIPSVEGMFNITHNCAQTLAPLEHCRITLAYVGDTATKRLVQSQLQLNTHKSVPINLDIMGTVTPVVEKPEPKLPEEIVLRIGLDDPHTVYYEFDVGFLSSKNNILPTSLIMEYDDEQMHHWGYGEHVLPVDVSSDPTVGQYRLAPKYWSFIFFTHRDADDDYQHLVAQPGIYKALIKTDTADIPVTVIYREDDIPESPDEGNPDEGNPDEGNPDEEIPSEGGGEQGGGSGGGSLGWGTMLMLLLLKRRK